MHELLSGFNSSVIEALGLNADKMLARYIQHQEESGKNHFEWWSRHRSSGLQVFVPGVINGLFIEHDAEDFSQVPSLIKQRWVEVKKELFSDNEQYARLGDIGIYHHIKGIGDAAVEDKDWTTVVCTFDEITEGGIMQNKVILKKLREEAQGHIDNGEIERSLEIANLLQGKVSTRKQATSTSAHSKITKGDLY